MDNDDVVKVIAAIPEARKLGDEAYWEGVVPALLKQVLDEISCAYDFGFVLKQYSDVVTVVDQADYEIKGDKNYDCRDIVSIRLGTNKKVLTRLRPLDVDGLVSDVSGAIFGSVAAWTEFELSTANYPKITLYDTPKTAGEALHVRYRMKDVPLNRFPESFGYVIARGVLAWLGDTQISATETRVGLYRNALKEMIGRYRTGGKDINLAQLDPQIVAGNAQRSSLNQVG